MNDIYKNSGAINQQITLESEKAVLPLLSKGTVELSASKPLSKVQLRCENKVVNYNTNEIDKILISKTLTEMENTMEKEWSERAEVPSSSVFPLPGVISCY